MGVPAALGRATIKLLGEIIDFGGSKGKAAAVRKYGEDNVKKAIDHLPKHAQIKKNKALAEDFVNAFVKGRGKLELSETTKKLFKPGVQLDPKAKQAVTRRKPPRIRKDKPSYTPKRIRVLKIDKEGIEKANAWWKEKPPKFQNKFKDNVETYLDDYGYKKAKDKFGSIIFSKKTDIGIDVPQKATTKFKKGESLSPSSVQRVLNTKEMERLREGTGTLVTDKHKEYKIEIPDVNTVTYGPKGQRKDATGTVIITSPSPPTESDLRSGWKLIGEKTVKMPEVVAKMKPTAHARTPGELALSRERDLTSKRKSTPQSGYSIAPAEGERITTAQASPLEEHWTTKQLGGTQRGEPVGGRQRGKYYPQGIRAEGRRALGERALAAQERSGALAQDLADWQLRGGEIQQLPPGSARAHVPTKRLSKWEKELADITDEPLPQRSWGNLRMEQAALGTDVGSVPRKTGAVGQGGTQLFPGGHTPDQVWDLMRGQRSPVAASRTGTPIDLENLAYEDPVEVAEYADTIKMLQDYFRSKYAQGGQIKSSTRRSSSNRGMGKALRGGGQVKGRRR